MVNLKTKKEIKIMREAGKICASIMLEVLGEVRPGDRTIDVDDRVERLCKKYRAIPAFKGYRGFKHVSCTCVNEGIVHCVPSDRFLIEGDVFSLDFGVLYKGYYSDHARTIGIGKVSKEKKRLIQTANNCLQKGINAAKIGNYMGDIGYNIQKTALLEGFNVIGPFGGHGIGKDLHEDPFVANFGFKGEEELIVEGMVLALEPLVCEKKCDYKVLEDNWTVISQNPVNLVAHFEDVIAITNNGPEILTRV